MLSMPILLVGMNDYNEGGRSVTTSYIHNMVDVVVVVYLNFDLASPKFTLAEPFQLLDP